MSATLDVLGPLLERGLYNVEFAPTRLGSTTNGLGSIFAYRPMIGADFRTYQDMRPWRLEHKVVFAGCVSAILVEREPDLPWGSLTIVTLTLPPNANVVAQEIMTRQDQFLQEISGWDALQAPTPSRAWCGSSIAPPPSTPLSISVSFPSNVRRMGQSTASIDFNLGDDIICKTALVRVDQDDGQLLSMRYLLRGSVYNILHPGELREA